MNTTVTEGQKAAGFALAAVLMIVLAEYLPHLINGVLALILAGVILKNTPAWQGQIQSLGNLLNGKTAAAGSK